MQFLSRSIRLGTTHGRENDKTVSLYVEKGGYLTNILGCIHVIHQYIGKGNPQVYDNHRGISLLAIAGKIHVLANFQLNRLNIYLDQTGFIPEKKSLWFHERQSDNRHDLHNRKKNATKTPSKPHRRTSRYQ